MLEIISAKSGLAKKYKIKKVVNGKIMNVNIAIFGIEFVLQITYDEIIFITI